MTWRSIKAPGPQTGLKQPILGYAAAKCLSGFGNHGTGNRAAPAARKLHRDRSTPIIDSHHRPANVDDESHSRIKATLRAAARGLFAAMAMSGAREVSTNLGLLERVPPDEILKKRAPELLHGLSQNHKEVVVELAHWTYGAGGGWLFGMLPHRVRRSRAAGVGYGIAVWLAFELAIGPMLGIARAKRHTVASRVMLAADHILYGLVVAGQLAPEPARNSTVTHAHVERGDPD